MSKPISFWQFVASNVEPYLTPQRPLPVTLIQLFSEDGPLRLRATPPALDPGVVSLELHYTPSGGTEQVISLTTDPVTFDVDTAGTLSYFTVALNAAGVKSDPCPTATFGVTDTTGGNKPPVPQNVTLEQVG